MISLKLLFGFGVIFIGSLSTISSKFADLQCVPDYRTNPASSCSVPISGTCSEGCRPFKHPFVQAAVMFFGELLCLVAYHISNLFSAVNADAVLPLDGKDQPRNFSPFIFALPALCDMFGACISYGALFLTYASVHQMLKGSVVVFTGMLSVIVLGRKLAAFHWVGMMLVSVGAFIVGLSSVIGQHQQASSVSAMQPSNPLLGGLLVVVAQLVSAAQVVVEERFVRAYRVHAMQVVGWEGFWGSCFISLLLFVMFYFPFGEDMCSSHSCIDNALSAVQEISSSTMLAAAIAVNLLCPAPFNFCGVSITKSLSATHRMVLDSLRTLGVWAVSLALGWQAFQPLQVLGFAVLVSGSMVYNEVVRLPWLDSARASSAAENGTPTRKVEFPAAADFMSKRPLLLEQFSPEPA